MLTAQHLTTIRAALQYWEEEMCPHGSEAMRPYYGGEDGEPARAVEVAKLRSALKDATVRYARYDDDRKQLASADLFDSPELAMAESQPAIVVAVLVPADTDRTMRP